MLKMAFIISNCKPTCPGSSTGQTIIGRPRTLKWDQLNIDNDIKGVIKKSKTIH